MSALLAHVSDLHLPFRPQLSWRQQLSKRQLSAWSWRRRAAFQRPEIVDALVRDLRDQAPRHVVVTGDVTNFSLPAEFDAAAAWLQALGTAHGVHVVPGNHDALVPVPAAQGLGRLLPWTGAQSGWPVLHRIGDVALIGVCSALPTPPLSARGRVGAAQLARLGAMLAAEGAAGRTRVVALHHAVAAGAVSWRKALADAPALRRLLAEAGCELVLHGHARDARLDAIPGARQPIPCLCVPSSSASPNAHDEGARWHALQFDGDRLHVGIRRWSIDAGRFVDAGGYTLCLPQNRTSST